jgi:hypothetical protein
MHMSKRAKLSAAPHTEQLPAEVIDKIMSYYKDLLIPGMRFRECMQEVQWRAQQFQERLHDFLFAYDNLDVVGCSCVWERSTFVLMCYSDTIDGYMPDNNEHCQYCREWYEQADREYFEQNGH